MKPPTISTKPYRCSRCGFVKDQETNHYGQTYSWGHYNCCPQCPPWAKYPEFGGSTVWECDAKPIAEDKVPTLYAEIKTAGIPFANHASDLYFKDTPESRAILDRHPAEKGNATRFVNQSDDKGQTWVDVPFAFLPFWEAKAGA